ncbi:hypothetical protein [Novosphingobium gossypii]|uniref:hypothetical protein n=1 Tax=Novosphingobium gossypii TaxID=1604774 RepID=UPI003D1BD78D
MGRFLRPPAVIRQGERLIPEFDGKVAIPDLGVLMTGGRAVIRVDGLIMGDMGSVSGMYVAPDGLTSDPSLATDIRGGPGQSVKGDAGNPAWTPMLAIETDGTARYLKVTDWAGGAGAKPATGYVGTTGITTKANAPNLNAAKKFGVFSGVSNAQGIATISFGTTFADSAAAPTIGHWGIPATAVGGTRTSVVANTLSKTGVQIKAEAPGLLGSVLNLLVGATVFVIATEQ